MAAQRSLSPLWVFYFFSIQFPYTSCCAFRASAKRPRTKDVGGVGVGCGKEWKNATEKKRRNGKKKADAELVVVVGGGVGVGGGEEEEEEEEAGEAWEVGVR